MLFSGSIFIGSLCHLFCDHFPMQDWIFWIRLTDTPIIGLHQVWYIVGYLWQLNRQFTEISREFNRHPGKGHRVDNHGSRHKTLIFSSILSGDIALRLRQHTFAPVCIQTCCCCHFEGDHHEGCAHSSMRSHFLLTSCDQLSVLIDGISAIFDPVTAGFIHSWAASPEVTWLQIDNRLWQLSFSLTAVYVFPQTMKIQWFADRYIDLESKILALTCKHTGAYLSTHKWILMLKETYLTWGFNSGWTRGTRVPQ